MTINEIYGVLGIFLSIVILEVSNEFSVESDKCLGLKKKRYQRRGYVLLGIGLIALITFFVLCVIFSDSAAP